MQESRLAGIEQILIFLIRLKFVSDSIRENKTSICFCKPHGFERFKRLQIVNCLDGYHITAIVDINWKFGSRPHRKKPLLDPQFLADKWGSVVRLFRSWREHGFEPNCNERESFKISLFHDKRRPPAPRVACPLLTPLASSPHRSTRHASVARRRRGGGAVLICRHRRHMRTSAVCGRGRGVRRERRGRRKENGKKWSGPEREPAKLHRIRISGRKCFFRQTTTTQQKSFNFLDLVKEDWS